MGTYSIKRKENSIPGTGSSLAKSPEVRGGSCAHMRGEVLVEDREVGWAKEVGLKVLKGFETGK